MYVAWQYIKSALFILALRFHLIRPVSNYDWQDYVAIANEHVYDKLSVGLVSEIEDYILSWLSDFKIYGQNYLEVVTSHDYDSRALATIKSKAGHCRRVDRRCVVETILTPAGMLVGLYIAHDDGPDKPSDWVRVYQATAGSRYQFRFIEEVDADSGNVDYRKLLTKDRTYSMERNAPRFTALIDRADLPLYLQQHLPKPSIS